MNDLEIKVSRRATGETPATVVDLTDRQRAIAWRSDCPTCEAPIVAMSEVAPSEPSSSPPNVGDAIRCCACGHYALVHGVEETPDHGRRMKLHKIEVPEA